MLVRPWPEHISFEDPSYRHATAIFMGISISKRSGHAQKGHTVDIREPVRQFVELVNSWREKGEYDGKCDLRVRQVAGKELASYVPDACTKLRRVSSQTLSEVADMMSASDAIQAPPADVAFADDLCKEPPSKRQRCLDEIEPASTQVADSSGSLDPTSKIQSAGQMQTSTPPPREELLETQKARPDMAAVPPPGSPVRAKIAPPEALLNSPSISKTAAASALGVSKRKPGKIMVKLAE